MNWFNYYGLAIMAIIMIPNIIFALTHKDGLPNSFHNKILKILEQVGRYGCFVFMIFNIPYTWIGFYFSFGELLYLIVNGVMLVAYVLSWVILWKRDGIVKAWLLSVLPSLIFLFSGIMIVSIPLIVFAIIFAITHIWTSVKNAKATEVSGKFKSKSILTVTAIFTALVVTFFSVFGGMTIYQQNQLSSLETMSAQDMIEYCCSGDTKISVAMIDHGNVTYHIYGANGEETKIYDYEIGSVSKTYVALLCAKAIDEGKLNLSDSIAKYLDLDEGKYYPTIERLLTHTSGYEAYYFESSMIGNALAHISNDFYGIDRDSILKRVKSVVLEDKDYPFNYSNFGISVVGLVLEKIYGDDFTDILNDYIKNELKLPSTFAATQSGNLTGYWKWKSDDGYIPAGSIISNINDMASYLNLYLTEGLPYASATYESLKELNATPSSNEKWNVRIDSIGMTWILDDVNDIVWHNGATTNFNSYIGFTKDRSKGVVILSNLNANDKITMTVIGAKLLIEGI
jgi:CubicO group peptidase (beta-lactamase class C family)